MRNPNNIRGHWRPERYKRQEVVEPLHKGGEPPANTRSPPPDRWFCKCRGKLANYLVFQIVKGKLAKLLFSFRKWRHTPWSSVFSSSQSSAALPSHLLSTGSKVDSVFMWMQGNISCEGSYMNHTGMVLGSNGGKVSWFSFLGNTKFAFFLKTPRQIGIFSHKGYYP